ncbi:MAG TPA: hypothetical protein VHQ47_20290 [Phycisphaerae bacterium]|nr:hypothetical protein [Phycisphaerae bacterium]
MPAFRLIVLATGVFIAAGCNTAPKPHPKVEASPNSTINDLNQPPPVDTNGRINRF